MGFLLVCLMFSMVSAHLNFVLDLDGLQLFDPIVQEALQRCVFDAAPFSVSVGTSGLVLSGTVSAQNGIACGRVQTQTVPIGTLTNASACSVSLNVNWSIKSGSKVLCSNSSLVEWTADQVIVYCIWGLSGVAPNRIEVRGINSTNLTTVCSGSLGVGFFNSMMVNATAKQMTLLLDKMMPFKSDFAPFPELPFVFVNLSMAQSPTVQRTNISGNVAGLFYEQGALSPPTTSCLAIPPWGSLPGLSHAGVRFSDCWFDSLAIALHNQGLFEGKLQRKLLGLDVEIYLSSKPLDFVSLARSSSLNASLHLEVVSGEFDRASFSFGVLLPLNLSVSSSGMLLTGRVPNVRLEDLNATFDVENYNLPVNASDLKPLLLVILQQDVLGALNKVLANGMELPFRIADAVITVGYGFVELLGRNFTH